MTCRNLTLMLSLVLSLQVAKATSAVGDDFTTCLGETARADLAGKAAYQCGLRDLIVERQPGFAALADLNRDIQVLFAEMRFARMDYLLSTRPEGLDGLNGLSRFRNFDWTEEDLEGLTAARPDYGDQIARLEVLKTKNQDHADWPALRAFIKGELSQDAAFSRLTAEFMEHNAAMETRLADCQGK